MKLQDALFKIIIFGDGGVGKTTLVSRYLTGLFKGNTTITIGVDFHIKKIDLEDKKISLQIWDFAGEERFRFLLPNYVKGAAGGIFMYDITRYSSLKNITDWLEVFRKGAGKAEQNIPILLVGGKIDLDHKRAVEKEYAMEVAKDKGLYGYIECSSKTGKNVETIFKALTRVLMEKSGLL